MKLKCNEQLIKQLSWFQSPERLSETIDEIEHQANFDYKSLIMPFGHKECWDGCAMAICRLKDDSFYSLVPELLIWLQDLTWPGAQVIFTRLSNCPTEEIGGSLKEALQQAKASNDQEWYCNLLELTDSLETSK